MPWWAIPPVVLALGAGLIVFLARDRIRERGICPVEWQRKDLWIRDGILGTALVAAIVVGMFARERLNTEREARVKAEIGALERDQLTRQQVAGIAQAQAQLLTPTNRERLRENLEAIRVCGRSMKCRRNFAGLIRTVFIVRNGEIIAAPPKGQPRPAPPPASHVPVVTPPPKVIPIPGDDGADGAPGKDGRAGKDVDSAIVDGLDNRIHDLEQGLAALLGKVGGLLGRLCSLLRLCL